LLWAAIEGSSPLKLCMENMKVENKDENIPTVSTKEIKRINF
jgi:hypothetical protein